MTEIKAPIITAFADCNANSVVLRVPYDFAAELLANCPHSENQHELARVLYRASARSRKLRDALHLHGISEEQ